MSTANNVVIQLKGVSKSFKLYKKKNHRMREVLFPFITKLHEVFHALQDVSLSVHQGEIIGIIGRNGSGKSTLLKIISGVIEPSAGSVHTNGRIVPLLELGAGFDPEFTGRENIYFYNSVHGFSTKETDAMLESILDFAEIGSHIDQPLKTYSSGMRARLGFAVAININPDILILDEVFAVGDEMFRRKCHLKMQEFFNQGRTILYVTHSLEAIQNMCNRAILLYQGELLLDGPVKLVAREYKKLGEIASDKIESWKAEMRLLNQNTSIKEAIFGQILDLEKIKLNPVSPISSNDSSVNSESGKELSSRSETSTSTLAFTQASFEAGLKPKSTSIRKKVNVDVFECQIVTLDGRSVNNLLTGESYKIRYYTVFEDLFRQVSFQVQIADRIGGILSEIQYMRPPRLQDLVGQENKICVEWQFTCHLLEGLYFIHLGVFSRDAENTPVLLYHVSDAMAFRVQKNTFNKRGVVDIDLKCTVSVETQD